jgi:hypothetical protein
MRPFLLSLALVMMACGGADEAPAPEGDVAIALIADAPVHRGTNTFALTTVDDATRVEVMAWMPSMGHGAPVDPRVVKQSGSTYRIEDVMFSMPGTWELKVSVTCPMRHGARTFRYEVP